VVEPERRRPGYVFVAHVKTFRAELVQHCVHVDCVPEHNDVHHQAERAKLVLLSFAIALAQLAALTMKHDAGKLVATLAAVELDQGASATGLVVDKPQQVEGLDEPAQLLQRAG
jgi:hypothetical protein